jgi:hypothetical protein
MSQHSALSRLSSAVCALALATLATSAAAQEQLGARRTVSVAPLFESWSFGDGLVQITSAGDHVRLSSATQLSVPLTAALFVNDRWQVGLSGAFATGTVKLDTRDATLGVTEYTVNGISDVKLGVTAHLVPDRVMVTLGINAPSGKTELSGEELEAVRILGSPALGFQVPALGTGTAGTAGLVLAREAGGWAWAAAASYEYRGSYSPIVLAAGIPTPDFNPSDAAHVSLNGQGLVGQHEMSLGIGADVYTKDKLQFSGRGDESTTQLGPIITADWRLRLATHSFRELTLFVNDQFRTEYKSAGKTVSGSSGNYLNAGISGVIGAGAAHGHPRWRCASPADRPRLRRRHRLRSRHVRHRDPRPHARHRQLHAPPVRARSVREHRQQRGVDYRDGNCGRSRLRSALLAGRV